MSTQPSAVREKPIGRIALGSDRAAKIMSVRAAISRVETNVVPSQFLVDVFREFGIDASIIPISLSAFTHFPTIALAERLSVMIAAGHG